MAASTACCTPSSRPSGCVRSAWTRSSTRRASLDAAETAGREGPIGLIMLETPANPTAAVADIALAARVAKRIGERQAGRRPLVTVDNTFLGPFGQTPLAHGADLTHHRPDQVLRRPQRPARRRRQRREGPGRAAEEAPHGAGLPPRSVLELAAAAFAGDPAAAHRSAPPTTRRRWRRFLRDHPKVAARHLSRLPPGQDRPRIRP